MNPPSQLPTTLHRPSDLGNEDTDDESPFRGSRTAPVGYDEGNEEYHYHGPSSLPNRLVTRSLSNTLNPSYSPPSLSPRVPEGPTRQFPPSIKENNQKNLVSWSDLPHKSQLAILTAARLSEPLVQTSIQSYMFYQLRSFSPALPDSTIASQAGMLVGAFTGAQFLTAMLWGRAADSARFGRKPVLLVGLLGTMVSCLGYGFARNFWQAVLCRAAGGALNGNVGVMRTMISEIIKEKRFQSRAFLLLPLCFNIGVIVGPVLGGILADPAGSYPRLFGGSEWLKTNPYAPPNLLSAVFLLLASIAVWLGLEETLPSIEHKDDLGIRCGRKLAETWARLRGRNTISYQNYLPLAENDIILPNHSREASQEDVEMSPATPKHTPIYTQRLSFRRIFTPNVISTLIVHGLLASHIGTFNSLWFVFLSTPVSDPAHPGPNALKQHLPFIFTGGLGMPPIHVGTAMAVLGVIGITMQLVVYPYVNARLGTVRSWRIFLFCFPVAYILVPFLSLVPSHSPPPKEKDGWRIWVALLGVLLVQVVGRTFVLPAMNILVNNCSPHPSVLGTLHGLAQSVSSGMRTVGPLVGGALYGAGLEYGIVGAVWWGLSGVAMGCVAASAWVSEGDGHEIWLEGDVDEDGERK